MQRMTLETKQAHLFVEMYYKWTDFDRGGIENEFLNWKWETFDDWENKYGSDQLNWRKIGHTAAFYEGSVFLSIEVFWTLSW